MKNEGGLNECKSNLTFAQKLHYKNTKLKYNNEEIIE